MNAQAATVGLDPVQADFALSKGTGLTIRAADGLTGLLLHGLFVVALSGAGTASFQGSVPLDSGGTGEISSLGPGRYSIHFFSDGYASRSLTVDVPSAPVSLGLTPGGRVEVRTRATVTGRLVNGAGATCLVSPWRFDGRVTAEPPVTTWSNLAPGSYRFLADGEKSAPFTVAEGQTRTLELP